jgi:mannose-6-phosphate isomerase-like protein (cupin superfamily)
MICKVIERGAFMKGFLQDIESLAVKNAEFRRVLYTAKNCQLVLMALKPKEEIGAEVHTLDQFFRVEEGTGEAVLDGVRTPIRAGFAVVVPAGANHNIINTGTVPLKLYTLYAPRITETASSTIPAKRRRRTTSTLTVRRRNRESTECSATFAEKAKSPVPFSRRILR